MKFAGKLEAAHLLGVLLADHLFTTVETRPAVIVPVPLHRRRLRARGFNQSLEIARPVAKKLAIRLDPWSVRRCRSTRPQSELASASERRRNVRGAFEVAPGVGAIPYVALVDDVMTTGATCGELVRELKRCGVGRVDVWIATRA